MGKDGVRVSTEDEWKVLGWNAEGQSAEDHIAEADKLIADIYKKHGMEQLIKGHMHHISKVGGKTVTVEGKPFTVPMTFKGAQVNFTEDMGKNTIIDNTIYNQDSMNAALWEDGKEYKSNLHTKEEYEQLLKEGTPVSVSKLDPKHESNNKPITSLKQMYGMIKENE